MGGCPSRQIPLGSFRENALASLKAENGAGSREGLFFLSIWYTCQNNYAAHGLEIAKPKQQFLGTATRRSRTQNYGTTSASVTAKCEGCMNDKKILVERRKFRRFRVKHPAFVVFNTQPTKLGEILDVSMNGLSFRYMVDSEELVNQSRELDILYGDDDFYLDKLHFRTVADRMTNNGLPFSTMIMRRRGVQFCELVEAQQSQLEYFIKHNTSGETQ
jgi:hypothetical protein